jgi:hypothetical protein
MSAETQFSDIKDEEVEEDDDLAGEKLTAIWLVLVSLNTWAFCLKSLWYPEGWWQFYDW